jgi:tRNA pseudouridine38-40 synthase
MPLRNIKLLIAYNGKRYSGWQIQNNDVTIQGVIEDALAVMHKHEIKITGAGRTDAGVHARGQVANFFTDIDSISSDRFSPAINSFLPDDIRILESVEVIPSFNSRYDALVRVYKYYISCNSVLMPWERDFSMQINKKIDISFINSIADVITGEHNFSSFSSPIEKHVSPVRKIYSSSFYAAYPFIVYKIAGNGFLRKMVRSIVGTILQLYRNGGNAEEMKKIIEKENRLFAGPVAPARGLFLDSVSYKVDNIKSI